MGKEQQQADLQAMVDTGEREALLAVQESFQRAFFPDESSRLVDLLDWNRQEETLFNLLDVLVSPLKLVLNHLVQKQLGNNVATIHNAFPDGVLLGPISKNNISGI